MVFEVQFVAHSQLTLDTGTKKPAFYLITVDFQEGTVSFAKNKGVAVPATNDRGQSSSPEDAKGEGVEKTVNSTKLEAPKVLPSTMPCWWRVVRPTRAASA